MANVTTSKETNTISVADLAKVRELDFVQTFGENINKFVEMLGVTRKIPVTAGTVLKKLTVTGTLQSGAVSEGEIIPLSKYATTWTSVGEATLNKYRKATTAEAILKGGFDQAVNETNRKMILDIQKTIRAGFITSLADGTGTASGATLQPALANAWGQLQVAFEDDDIQSVFFINPLDVADYLGSAQITVQTAFGFSYVENFLGLGTAILTAQVDKGTFYATAADNIVLYYVDATETADGLGRAFDFTTDPETGFVGVHEDSNYQRMQSETVAIAGVDVFAEMPAGVIVGTIGDESES